MNKVVNLSALRFRHAFRTHQTMILDRFQKELATKKPGEPLRFHVVAPPGAGKTIIGLELAIKLKAPALIVCPNTAIQGQWVKKLELFLPENGSIKADDVIASEPDKPHPINVLTYQILSIPEDAGETLVELAEGLWAETLSNSLGAELEEARGRIAKMKESNASAYKKELAKYIKSIRNGKLMGQESDKKGQNAQNTQTTQGAQNAQGSLGSQTMANGQGAQIWHGAQWAQSADAAPQTASPGDGRVQNGTSAGDQKYLAISILHKNTRELLQRLKDAGVKTVIFDECHHLQTYWAVVMKQILEWMEIENIIGLTATPPIDEKSEVLQNYMSLLGEIDFQIPTPAVVKDGMLAPYQDMTYFCLPQENEMAYLNSCHSKFQKLIEGFSSPQSDFCKWMIDRIIERKLADGSKREWRKLFAQRPDFSCAGVKYLRKAGIKLPSDITLSSGMYGDLSVEEWAMLIEDYALNRLKLSSEEEHKRAYDEIKDALYTLGFILTETGIRTYISPLDRVLSYSKSKLKAVKDILRHEMKLMGESIRAAVVTDFEFSNALSLKKLDNVLDEECGGAISVMKELVTDEELDRLNPVMVTGKSLLCDDDIAEEYLRLFNEWAREQSLDIRLSMKPGFGGKLCEIEGYGSDWNTKSAILFTTSIFEKGLSKCIIGTRGLLGEGWDSVSLNTLIDLCCASTYASVNQLRGRSIRKDEKAPRKLANNWDVVTYASELKKGDNDYKRLVKKHEQFYSICDDGRIQKGVGHVHPILTFREKLGTEDINQINEHMFKKASIRNQKYDSWKIGERFYNVEQ
ncbi:MAG: DEAD/DEAH box helicase family protein, partial [Clostridia bacterium]|nr:DEAD/DEAH box helicase family protein [Clostridia bacterium]